jgi:serine/threonine protein kinase
VGDLVTGEAAGLAGRRWVFGPATFDERSLELLVNGRRVTIERRPLEVLLYLLHHAGEVVTKDDLAECLWPGRVLTDTVLTRCISVLRTVLEDTQRKLIQTVHGFGYRLIAQVRAEASTAAGSTVLAFKPGDCPPTRPQWRLVERLGVGGHGEAWLARHEKTGDARVFKFAVSGSALSSFKREITIYRLLHDSLGARAAVARILEWNVEDPPYFIEMEHIAGGNLHTWAETQGGLAGVPLAVRLDLAAQVVEALAAAHSVGVLHKDLKPGNVLVHTNAGQPSIRLCDFGSGSVLDPERLEALGITRLGFTKTMARESATPLYLAPEVISGQPFTVQADIYALGILLYQIVVADLRKALAPGWEADVDDELLREDIAAAAAGNPERRLTDAVQLAERLRALEQRREARIAEVAARARAERVRRIQAELRRTRAYALVFCVLAAIAVTGGIVAYRARNEAVAATATAKAVSDFLMEDVLRMDSGLFRPSETSYESLLDRAAKEVGARLETQPAAAASVHSLLGRRYQEIGALETAAQQYERAVELFTRLDGRAADSTLLALDRLAWIHLENGRPSDALSIAEEMRGLWESRLPPSDLALLMVRVRITRVLISLGDYATSERELRSVLGEASRADASTERIKPLLWHWLGVAPPDNDARAILSAYGNLLLAGSVLEETGEQHEESENRLRSSLATFSRVLGTHAELSNLSRLTLSHALTASGRYEEAELLSQLARESLDKSLPVQHYARGLSRQAQGRLRVEQRRFAEAVGLFEEAVDLCMKGKACPPRVRAHFLWELGRGQNEAGYANAAINAFSAALALQEPLTGPSILTLRMRVGLADALRNTQRFDDAAVVLAAIDSKSLGSLKPYQDARGDLRRVEGLLFLQAGQYGRAVAALEEALVIVTRRAGASHWRTERALAELALAKRTAG